MTSVYTHYDNLKVARNAPPEVIRAAYKTLTQKYHPDRNPGNAEAARIMSIINTSYEVLSDPNRRLEHDQWIKLQEIVSTQTTNINNQPKPAPEAVSKPKSTSSITFGNVIFHILRNWLLYGFAVLMIWIWANDKPSAPPPRPKPYQTTPAPAPAPAKPKYVKPSSAPNGQPWPSIGYVKGYPQLNTEGLSNVTVDNSKNDSDVFVKLVSLNTAKAYPVRQFYIPAFGKFTLNKVTAGNYDIRYRDLSSGGLSRSEAFDLEETPTYNGTQYSNLTMTLYKVQNGNMQTYGLSEAEF